ncbi:von Willebrand domain-containing protein [Phanerochaete sordida]|uniref:von Willebrand domain-containing protein n=1 Tax=Phanerochaete sordida TaxID=48140 RepID=A0A9P3LFW4_9APHY|nr:von Willebrand domain-containing protein [Phanerochaete sordida]
MRTKLFGTRRPTCGIVHVQQDLSTVNLPLEQTEVHANVIDVSAIVTITQRFWQSSPTALAHAQYIFPVPARSAVCGFTMTTEDGAVIKAIAKERDEARKEYEDAIRSGQTAGLVEHVTDDVFSISVGALPGNQVITTTVTYVLDLMDGNTVDEVRLQIPKYVAERYGMPPQNTVHARQAPLDRVSISVDVHMQGAIRGVTSLTHPTLTVAEGGSAPTLRNTTYRSPDFLTSDFVLCIAADGLDAPRCIAESASTGAVAMQLNLVPKFNLPPIASQEYIFLVDRSGSMTGNRIETAKRALVMLLRALPTQGTHLNIFSFGNSCDSLWPESVEYNAESLAFATQHVDSMSANYGGTEIQIALEKVFASRRFDKPTACFVLTDGEAWNLAGSLNVVSDAVKTGEGPAPLRVFTLGIGSTTSSEMCEGIARRGNGICEMAIAAENIIGKCSKLVRASRTYILNNVGVDWGVHADAVTAVQQAPAKIPTIYPGNRFIVFALVEDKNFVPPTEVVLCGQRDGTGDVLRFNVPVHIVDVPADQPRHGLIPTLTARRLIMELDDVDQQTPTPANKARIVALGTAYQVASRYTSFVAVDTRTADEIALTTGIRALALDGPAARTRAKRRLDEDADANLSRIAEAYAALGTFTGGTPAAPPRPRGSGKAARKQLATTAARKTAAAPTGRVRTKQTARKSTGGVPVARGKKAGLPSKRARGAPGTAGTSQSVSVPVTTTVAVPQIDAAAFVMQSTSDKVFALVRLQAFDGSFPADESLDAIVGDGALAAAKALAVAEKVWATLLAIAFLKRHMQDKELLDGLVEKAMEYVAQAPDVDVEAVLARAQELVV